MSEEGSQFRTLFPALCLVLTLSMFVFVVSSAMTDYKLIKPLIMGVQPEPAEVKIVVLDFNSYFDVSTSTYKNVSIALRYTTQTNVTVTATVTVQIFDVYNNNIALGQKPYTIGPNVTVFDVIPLEWEPGKTVVDFASAKVTVQ